MTGSTQTEQNEAEWYEVPHEGELWELNMRHAENVTDEERRKDDRMYGDKFVRFTVRVVEVDTVVGGAAPVEMTVTGANIHRQAPEIGGTVMKHTDIMAEYPEWRRVSGA